MDNPPFYSTPSAYQPCATDFRPHMNTACHWLPMISYVVGWYVKLYINRVHVYSKSVNPWRSWRSTNLNARGWCSSWCCSWRILKKYKHSVAGCSTSGFIDFLIFITRTNWKIRLWIVRHFNLWIFSNAYKRWRRNETQHGFSRIAPRRIQVC